MKPARGAAIVVVLAFTGSVLAMLWAGRTPSSFLVLALVAVLLGAGHAIWGDSITQGVDAAEDLADGPDDGDGGGR